LKVCAASPRIDRPGRVLIGPLFIPSDNPLWDQGKVLETVAMDSTRSIPILVVDDDPSIAKLFVRVLQQEGYRPWACVHPDEALALLETEKFPLAFIDINLPVMSGLELGARVKARNQVGYETILSR